MKTKIKTKISKLSNGANYIVKQSYKGNLKRRLVVGEKIYCIKAPLYPKEVVVYTEGLYNPELIKVDIFFNILCGEVEYTNYIRKQKLKKLNAI